METDIKGYQIKGNGYTVYAWNDVSGYDYWKREGEGNSSNYIQITVAIETPDVDPVTIKKDVETAYDHFCMYDNTDNHDFNKGEK